MRNSNSMRLLKVFSLLAISYVVAGCASTGPKVSSAELKSKEEEFNRKFYEASDTWLPRVYRIGYRLLKAPVPGYSEAKAEFNFAGVGVEELEKPARDVFRIPKQVKGVLVLGLYPGSAADSEKVDLKRGDVIVKIDNLSTKNLGAYFKRIRKTDKRVVKAEVWQDGKTFQVDIPLEKVFYNAQFFLSPTPHFDANALFSKIQVGIGAIRYSRNDDELAVIMGHELAHTTLKHSLKKLGSNIGMALFYGAAAGAIDAVSIGGVGQMVMQPAMQASQAAVSRRYEREADYYGMQHAFHAGYHVKRGATIFSRLASDAPGFEVLAYTFSSHPKSPERFLRLEKIVEEFETKFPEKFPMQENPDWELIIPVNAGESLEEALDRMGKGVQVASPADAALIKKEPAQKEILEQTEKTAQVIPAPVTEMKEAPKVTIAENKMNDLITAQQVIQDFDFGIEAAATTSGTSMAIPANQDKSPASGYQAPKKS